MWPCKNEGEDARLYEAVKVIAENKELRMQNECAGIDSHIFQGGISIRNLAYDICKNALKVATNALIIAKDANQSCRLRGTFLKTVQFILRLLAWGIYHLTKIG